MSLNTPSSVSAQSYPYWFSKPDSNQQAHLYPAHDEGKPHNIAFGLDQVFVTPPVGALPASGPFALVPGTSPFTYQLTVPL